MDITNFRNIESWVAYTLKVSDPSYPRAKESYWSGGSYHGKTPLGSTWGIVYTYAPNVASLMEDSNWECILADLEKLHGEEGDNWVWEAIGHWMTPFRFLMIRMVNSDGTPSDIANWFFDVLARLDDYPIYNDDYHSELEWTTYTDAMHYEVSRWLKYEGYEIDPDSLLDYARKMKIDHYHTYWDKWYDENEGYPEDSEIAELAELYCMNQAGIPPMLAFYGI